MISRWNDRRIELFEISMPNEHLEFEGVMKFFYQYQDESGQKVAAKCIRVASTASVKDVIDVLVQKFRPDMRMLPNLSSYALYEVHNDEEERRMEFNEKPLLTMLKWTAHDIDGRFLLRNEINMSFSLHSKLIQGGKKNGHTKRKKKSPKVDRKKTKTPQNVPETVDVNNTSSIAKTLYSDYPQSHFTSSITDVTASSSSIGRDELPILMACFMTDKSIKSLLATDNDTAGDIISNAIEKYGMIESDNPQDFCLVQVTSGGSEQVLDNKDCPVKIHKEYQYDRSIHFELRRRRRDKEDFPMLMTYPDHHVKFKLSQPTIEIGSHVSLLDPTSHICLTSTGIEPRHCIIRQSPNGSSSYSLSLLTQSALVKVDNQTVTDSAQLVHDSIIQLGESELFQFIISSSNYRSTIDTAVLSKAVSSDDVGKSIYVKNDMKYRSERTLKGSVDDIYHHLNDINKRRHVSTPQDDRHESELAVLPASLAFTQRNEGHLLHCLIAEVDGSSLQFKLAPAYALYMAARHHLSCDFTPEPTRHHSLIHMLKSTCSIIKRTVKDSKAVAGSLAFWLANSSELLHFLRRDYQLYMFAHEFENSLTVIVHMAYKHFSEYMTREIGMHLMSFFNETSSDCVEGSFGREPDVVAISYGNHRGPTRSYWSPSTTRRTSSATFDGILSALNATSSLLHLCKVNDVLSLLIFNVLFHHISTRLFNILLTEAGYCTSDVGHRLLDKIHRLKGWADKENLKLPAEEHLELISQSARLLISSDQRNISASVICPSLNSQQIKALLVNVNDSKLIDKLSSEAYDVVDQKLILSGYEVHVQEDVNVDLPFLIPEHGYSCDTMKGVPVGLEEYLDSSITNGLCELIVSRESLGYWIPARIATSKQKESPMSTQTSSQMSQTLPRNFPSSSSDYQRHHPLPTDKEDVSLMNESIQKLRVTLKKGLDKTLGINICESKDPLMSSNSTGIFIKSLSKSGPAYQDGRLHPGDQILQIDNTSMRGYTKDLVIKLLKRSGSHVTVTVATHVAQYYQLEDVLSIDQFHRFIDEGSPPLAPKVGSSHAMKAARREMRRQQQSPSSGRGDYYRVSSPSGGVANPHMTKWLKEQQEIIHQGRPSSSFNRRISIPHVHTSMSSLVLEREEPSLPAKEMAHYNMVTSDDSQDHHGLPVTSHFTESMSDYYKYPSNASQQPSSAGLSYQQSDSSQTYPSLAREKLSMEVGYHTQLSSTGLSVTSVIDQLTRNGRKGSSGLCTGELEGLEVDEIQLEKQRMQLLFYRKQKDMRDKREEELTGGASLHDEESLDEALKMNKLKYNLESMKKFINEQRKRCRELQFAKEREEQGLAQAESKLKSLNYQLAPFLQLEDEAKWQREQKRRIKELERQIGMKRNELHQIEMKEIEARSKVKALEYSANEIKKQLRHNADATIATTITTTTGTAIPVKDDNEPLRDNIVLSRESMTTTGSSWISYENENEMPGHKEYPLYRRGGHNSPICSHSDTSSPPPLGSASSKWYGKGPDDSEIPTLIREVPAEIEGYPGNQIKKERQTKWQYRGGSSIDSYNIDSSLSSSTPDVVPHTLVQSHATNNYTKYEIKSSNSSDYRLPSRESKSHDTMSKSHDNILMIQQAPPTADMLLNEAGNDNSSSLSIGANDCGNTSSPYLPDPNTSSSRNRRNVPSPYSRGGPHSYSSGRPQATGGGGAAATPTGRYVQRQQTEL
jgi:afadin